MGHKPGGVGRRYLNLKGSFVNDEGLARFEPRSGAFKAWFLGQDVIIFRDGKRVRVRYGAKIQKLEHEDPNFSFTAQQEADDTTCHNTACCDNMKLCCSHGRVLGYCHGRWPCA